MPPETNSSCSGNKNSSITLAMIVRDGGQNFVSLLQDAQPWVEEIVVGDTGSLDGSIAAARSVQARILEIPWQDDFAAARNQVLAACRSAWIVILDADEGFSRQDWQKLRNWVTKQSPTGRQVAGNILTRNYLRERYGRRGWQPVSHPDPHAMASNLPNTGFVASSKVRIFPNRPDIRFQGRINETVEGSLREAQIKVVDLPWPVHHFGYLQQQPAKKQRYLHLAHLKTTAQPHSAQSWAELADCAIAVKNHEQALVAIERALLLEPADPEIRLTAGWILQEIGRFELAEEHLVAVTGLPEVPIHIRAEAAYLRAQIAIQCDRLEAALPLLVTASGLMPDNKHFRNTLSGLSLMLGHGAAAEPDHTEAIAGQEKTPEPVY